jgi:RecJ-like exonuclease
MYQKCPNCNGSGREYPIGTTDASFKTCSVCRGSKIIDTVTGLPPQNQYFELTPKAFDQHLSQIGREYLNDIEK